jgi:hypothetical protein
MAMMRGTKSVTPNTARMKQNPPSETTLHTHYAVTHTDIDKCLYVLVEREYRSRAVVALMASRIMAREKRKKATQMNVGSTVQQR